MRTKLGEMAKKWENECEQERNAAVPLSDLGVDSQLAGPDEFEENTEAYRPL
jgi:hypothetical protein